MQDRPRWASGTRSRAGGPIDTSRHQHGASKLPDRAAPQSFSWPQIGHKGLRSGTSGVPVDVFIGLRVAEKKAVTRSHPHQRSRQLEEPEL